MSKVRHVSGKETIAALERLGFVQVSQRGSHVVLRKKGSRGDIGCRSPSQGSGGGDAAQHSETGPGYRGRVRREAIDRLDGY